MGMVLKQRDGTLTLVVVRGTTVHEEEGEEESYGRKSFFYAYRH